MHRKDLQDLHGLSRAPFLAYLRKQAQPRSARPRSVAAKPSQYPTLAAFLPQHWWKWISEYFRFRLGRKHKFASYDGVDGDNGVYRLQGSETEIRIAIAGDWGTGTDEAALVAEQIEAYEPHYSIHLGDVYYVGDPAEVRENFLGLPNSANPPFKPCRWPSGREGTFALNGNHEMYARGVGYFDLILPRLGVRDSPHGQRASYFCLENDDWRIIALDTGYNSVGLPLIEYVLRPDCRLPPELMEWLETVVRPRPDDPRGAVILSHHQYYSRFDSCFAKPGRQLAGLFSRPVLWLWGHEHRLAIYNEASVAGGVKAFGRCLGHGGMPVELSTSVIHSEYEVEFVDERVYPSDENLTIGFNGFAKLTLRGKELSLDYVDLEGTKVFNEVWTADQGSLVRVTAQRGGETA